MSYFRDVNQQLADSHTDCDDYTADVQIYDWADVQFYDWEEEYDYEYNYEYNYVYKYEYHYFQ